ncbi:MAG: class I SAM-dependent methyltransferase [Candidatus Fermentibacteraceae bacterium]
MNLRGTRRHVFSLLPLRRVSRIVEPGCGTGLLTRELLSLTSARITCIDTVERPGLPAGCVFVRGDATKYTPSADIYISSFFLYQLREPVTYLRRVRRALGEGGLYAVAGEFSYANPRGAPVVSDLAASLREEGFDPVFGSVLGETFRAAGYEAVETGEVRPLWEAPDSEFLKLQLGARGGSFTENITVPVFWGVFRVMGNRG